MTYDFYQTNSYIRANQVEKIIEQLNDSKLSAVEFLNEHYDTILETSRFNLIYAILEKQKAFNAVSSYVVALSLLSFSDCVTRANSLDYSKDDWRYYLAIFNDDKDTIEEVVQRSDFEEKQERLAGIAAALGRLDILRQLIPTSKVSWPLEDVDQAYEERKLGYCHMPLCLAIAFNQQESLEVLVEKMNDEDDDWYNVLDIALHHVAVYGQLNMAKWLVERGADLHEDYSSGNTLCIAVKYGYGKTKFISWLFTKYTKEQLLTSFTWSGILDNAACNGNKPLVRFLIDSGFDVNEEFQKGCINIYIEGQSKPRITPLISTALQEILNRDDIEMAKFLLENGANFSDLYVDGEPKEGLASLDFLNDTIELDRLITTKRFDQALTLLTEKGVQQLFIHSVNAEKLTVMQHLVQNFDGSIEAQECIKCLLSHKTWNSAGAVAALKLAKPKYYRVLNLLLFSHEADFNAIISLSLLAKVFTDKCLPLSVCPITTDQDSAPLSLSAENTVKLLALELRRLINHIDTSVMSVNPQNKRLAMLRRLVNDYYSGKLVCQTPAYTFERYYLEAQETKNIQAMLRNLQQVHHFFTAYKDSRENFDKVSISPISENRKNIKVSLQTLSTLGIDICQYEVSHTLIKRQGKEADETSPKQPKRKLGQLLDINGSFSSKNVTDKGGEGAHQPAKIQKYAT